MDNILKKVRDSLTDYPLEYSKEADMISDEIDVLIYFYKIKNN